MCLPSAWPRSFGNLADRPTFRVLPRACLRYLLYGVDYSVVVNYILASAVILYMPELRQSSTKIAIIRCLR